MSVTACGLWSKPALVRLQVSASVYYAASLYHKQQKEYALYYRQGQLKGRRTRNELLMELHGHTAAQSNRSTQFCTWQQWRTRAMLACQHSPICAATRSWAACLQGHPDVPGVCVTGHAAAGFPSGGEPVRLCC